MKKLYLVNASYVLPDAEIAAMVAPLQTQIDRDFMPHWQSKVIETQIEVGFASIGDIPSLPPDCWPLFFNRHSNEDALGWHDDDPSQNIRTYSRVFAGDCVHLGLSVQTTASHEALELILDPDIQRAFWMADGRLAALEVADATEADELAYSIDGFMASDFVLPSYFSANLRGPFDFRGHLGGRCPALTAGGYMSVTDAAGRWTQVSMDRDGLLGRRAAMHGYRRMERAERPLSSFLIET